MTEHDPERERSVRVAPRGRRRQGRFIITAGLAAIAAIGALASFPATQSLTHRMLTYVPVFGPSLAAAAPFEDGAGTGFPGLVSAWRDGLSDSIVQAVVEARADRAVRHLAIEIDATPEQVDKLRGIVRDAVKDLVPMRTRIMTARATAQDLLTQDTVDRAAVEKFRTDMLATHDVISKRLFQAVADAAEALTPEQRRKLAEMAAAHRAHRWSGGPWSRGPWGHWGEWRN